MEIAVIVKILTVIFLVKRGLFIFFSFIFIIFSDITCGRLQCIHESEKPIFGDPSTIYSAYSYVRTSSGKDEICRVVRTTIAGTGEKRKSDPGMVPDGAECGENRVSMFINF